MNEIYKLKSKKELAGIFCYGMKNGCGFLPCDWDLKQNRDAMKERIFIQDGVLACNKFVDDLDTFNLGLEPRSQVKLDVDLKNVVEYQIKFELELEESKEDGSFFELSHESLFNLDKPEPILRVGVKDGFFSVSGIASGLSKEQTSFNKPIKVVWDKVMKFRIDMLLLDNNEGYLRIYMDDGKADVLVWSNSTNTTLNQIFPRVWCRIGVVGGLSKAIFSNFTINNNDF